MSNNRLWLVDIRTNEKILFAKYYPSTGWYMFHSQEHIDDWFDKVKRPEMSEDALTFGSTYFRLLYDHVVEDNDYVNKANAREL